MHSNKQMICWLSGTGLLALKKTNKEINFQFQTTMHPKQEKPTLPHSVSIWLDVNAINLERI